MDGLSLLAEARASGLIVLVGKGGRLVVRGRHTAEPLARRLLENKPAVLAALSIGGEWHEWNENRNGTTWHVSQRDAAEVWPWA